MPGPLRPGRVGDRRRHPAEPVGPSRGPGGTFNDNGGYTGCAFDARGDFFATDLGNAQGQIPIPSSGRLIEWSRPDYTSYCIFYGPTEGGDGPQTRRGFGPAASSVEM